MMRLSLSASDEVWTLDGSEQVAGIWLVVHWLGVQKFGSPCSERNILASTTGIHMTLAPLIPPRLGVRWVRREHPASPQRADLS